MLDKVVAHTRRIGCGDDARKLDHTAPDFCHSVRGRTRPVLQGRHAEATGIARKVIERIESRTCDPEYVQLEVDESGIRLAYQGIEGKCAVDGDELEVVVVVGEAQAGSARGRPGR